MKTLIPTHKNETSPRALVQELLHHQARALMHAIEANTDTGPLRHSGLCLVELCSYAASAIALLSILVERQETLMRRSKDHAERLESLEN